MTLDLPSVHVLFMFNPTFLESCTSKNKRVMSRIGVQNADHINPAMF